MSAEEFLKSPPFIPLELPEPPAPTGAPPLPHQQAAEPASKTLVRAAAQLALESPRAGIGLTLSAREFYLLLTWIGRGKYAFNKFKNVPGKATGENSECENNLALLDLAALLDRLAEQFAKA